MRALATTCLALSAMTGCRFDDIQESAWSDSRGKPSSMPSSDYGVGISTVDREQPGATLVVAGADPIGLATLSYDDFGQHTQRGIAIDAEPDGQLVVAGAGSQVQGGDGMVVVGGVQGAALLVYDPRTGAEGPLFRRSIPRSECEGLDAPVHAAAFGQLDIGNDGEAELVALSGDRLLVFEDVRLVEDSVCYSCRVTLDAEPARAVSLALGVVGHVAGQELEGIYVSVASQGKAGALYGLTASDVMNANGGDCFSSARISVRSDPQNSEGLAGLGGEEDFGLHIAVGEMDIPLFEGEPEIPELALTTPSSGRVYVIRNAPCDAVVGAPATCNTPMGPTLRLQTLVSPADSGLQFGESLIFGDFNGDDGEELAIGDPSATPQGKIDAGFVAVYTDNQGDLRLTASLFDSTPVTGQGFGRGLSSAEFIAGEDDADLLIVAAHGEVFTYFQALIGAGEDAELDIRE